MSRCPAAISSSPSTLNLVNAHCLEMWAFRQEELELGPLEGSNYTLLVLHLGADGHCNLAHVDPGHCALGLPKAPCVPVWSLHWGQHGSPECPRPLRATWTGRRLHTLPRRLSFAGGTQRPPPPNHGERSTVDLPGRKPSCLMLVIYGLLFLISLARGLSTSLIFSKNQLPCYWFFSIVIFPLY